MRATAALIGVGIVSSPPLPDLQVDAAFLPLDINQIIDNSPVCDSNYINQLPDDDDFSLRTKVTQHYRQQKKHHQQYYQGDENPIEQFGDRYEHQEDNNFDEDCDEEEGVPVALQFTEHSNQVHQQRVPFQHVENHPEAMARPKRTTTQGGKGVTGSGKGAKKPKTSSNSRSLQVRPQPLPTQTDFAAYLGCMFPRFPDTSSELTAFFVLSAAMVAANCILVAAVFYHGSVQYSDH